MPDLSAGRPSTPPEEQFTEADVALIAVTMAEAHCYCPVESRCSSHYVEAEAALTALAAANRLLPASSEHREEWGCLVTEPHARRSEQVGDVIKLTEEQARYGPTIHSGWTTVKRVNGPWIEMDGSPTDA